VTETVVRLLSSR